MALTFSRNDLGITYQVKLIDCIDMADRDVSDIVEQSIVFRKPDGTRFEKTATLDADPENPSQVIPLNSIGGNALNGTVLATIPDTLLLRSGEIMSITGTNSFDIENVPLTVVNVIAFSYNLGTVGNIIAENSGDITTQGEFLITYTNGNDGNPSEDLSILDIAGNWEYYGKIKLSNDDTFVTPFGSVFWVR
jgi:hypothetical protein